jgi:hypothetical protein
MLAAIRAHSPPAFKKMRISCKGSNLASVDGLHGGGGMANLLDYRAQEALCRIHALTDEQHRDLWLSMAERWSYLANEETTTYRAAYSRAAPRISKE